MNLKIILGVIGVLTALFTAATAYWQSGTSKESSGAKIENSIINKSESKDTTITDSIIQNGNGNNAIKNSK